VTRAYKDLVARYHPDRHQDNELKDLAEEKLAELNTAYEVLSDPGRRAAHDSRRSAAPPFPGDAEAPRAIQRFDMGRAVKFLAVVAIAWFSLRFIRSPRALMVIGVAVVAAWFGPRLWRLIRGRKK